MKILYGFLILSLLSVFCLSSHVEAQRGSSWSNDDLLSDFRSVLDLSENQVTSMRSVVDNLSGDMDSLVNKYKDEGLVSLLSMGSDVDSIVSDTIDACDNILTDKQKKMLEDSDVFKGNLKTKLQEGFKNGIFADISEMLDLSEDVGKKVESVLEKDFDQRKDLIMKYENSSDSKIKKLRSFLDGNSKITENSLGNLEDILTKDQLEELKSMADDLMGNIKKKGKSAGRRFRR
jgi:hypothetical protein